MRRTLLFLLCFIQTLLGSAFALDIAQKSKLIYTYLYPGVIMEVTRQQMLAQVGGPNQLAHSRDYPTAEFRTVVRPNFDTLYTSAWFDVKDEPVLIKIPDLGDRYAMFPFLDMWTEVFASIVNESNTFHGERLLALVPPHWRGALPKDAMYIEAPTRWVWMIGRIYCDGPGDYPAVHRLQDEMQVMTLSEYLGKPPKQKEKEDFPYAGQGSPLSIVDKMPAKEFYQLGFSVYQENKPSGKDRAVKNFSIESAMLRGQTYDLEALKDDWRVAFLEAQRNVNQALGGFAGGKANAVNGWKFTTEGIGNYGTDYQARALVARVGLGANRPSDAVYPSTAVDSQGQPLDGRNHAYKIVIQERELPPVDGFWSLTLYDADGYPVANSLNRHVIRPSQPLVYEADGSLELYIQADEVTGYYRNNWLPAPQGPFTLTMRLYGPRYPVFSGEWKPPLVNRVD